AGAGDAVAVEGGEQGGAVRRAVGQVAVVVVRGAQGAPQRAGGAAVRGPGSGRRAGEGAGRGRPREIPEPLGDRPCSGAPRARQVAGGEVPQRLRGDVRLAVPFEAAGADVARPRRTVGLGEAGDRGWRGRAVLGVVDVAHAGAGGAGVAVAAAVGGAEAGSDTGAVRHQRGGEVAVGLARAVVRGKAVAVVLVEAVTILMQRHGGDLAGVVAAAAGAEEVQGAADVVPVGVAGLVQVDVDGQLPLQPGVGGQPRAPRFL